jgi:hypothetical protein
MAQPRGKIDAVCQNPKCRYFLNEKGKDIIKSGRYKKHGSSVVLLLSLQDLFHGDQRHAILSKAIVRT